MRFNFSIEKSIFCWIALLLGLLTPITVTAQRAIYRDEYPQSSLKCYSSLTKPDMELICPEARSNFCVKEVSDLKEDLCGQTQYFGDLYVNAECVFKKCSTECVEGAYQFEYGGQKYTRTRYCCQDKNYCNAASRSLPRSSVLALACMLLISVFFMTSIL